jgi:hypothetical protein
MGRLNYSLPPQPNFGLNFDLLWIPDIRPTQFGPLDHSMSAPYTTFLFQGLKSFNIRQAVPTNKQEYGAKMTVDFGNSLSLSAVYFRDANNDPGIVLKDFVGPAPTTASMTHPMQDVYGGYFSYHFSPLDVVIRGEVSQYSATPVSIPRPDVVRGPSGIELHTFRLKPVTQWMLGFDKKKLVPWLSVKDTSSFTCQWLHKNINDWDRVMKGSTNRDFDLLTFSASWYWFRGTVNPSLAVNYIPSGRGSFLTVPVLSWQISEHVYARTMGMIFWGDKDSKSQYAGLISTSELTFKLGYEW